MDVHVYFGFRNGELLRGKLLRSILETGTKAAHWSNSGLPAKKRLHPKRPLSKREGEEASQPADNPGRLQGCAGWLVSFPTCLQEEADLLHQVEQALLSLVQGASDGDGEPFLDRLGIALEEELGGRAVLGMDRVLEGLGQKDGGGADGTVWAGRRRKTARSTLSPRDQFPLWEDNVEIESDSASRPLPGHRRDRSLSTSRHRITGKAPRSPLR